MAKKYQASLTSGDLLQEEISTILNSVSSADEIKSLRLHRDQVSLKVKSEKSFTRMLSEISRRIKAVPELSVWNYYMKAPDNQQKLILFYAILMTYDLLLDFMLDVVHEKWINLNMDITRKDFLDYVEQKSRTTPELEAKSKRSISDMGYNMLKVMRQAGIVKNKQLSPLMIDEELQSVFDKMGEGWFIEVLPKK